METLPSQEDKLESTSLSLSTVVVETHVPSRMMDRHFVLMVFHVILHIVDPIPLVLVLLVESVSLPTNVETIGL